MLKAPTWAKHATPTQRGWVDPRTGELLISRKHSERQLTEYWNAKNRAAPAPAPKPAPAPAPEPIIEADPEPVVEETAEVLTEAEPDAHADHLAMTKAQLVEHAALEHGLNLDMTLTKAEMIDIIEGRF